MIIALSPNHYHLLLEHFFLFNPMGGMCVIAFAAFTVRFPNFSIQFNNDIEWNDPCANQWFEVKHLIIWIKQTEWHSEPKSMGLARVVNGAICWK